MAFDPAFRSGRRVSYKFLHYSECACSVGSMRPVVPENSAVLGLRTSYAFSPPERGDIVFFKRSDISSALLIKRIVALPGETLRNARRARVHKRRRAARGLRFRILKRGHCPDHAARRRVHHSRRRQAEFLRFARVGRSVRAARRHKSESSLCISSPFLFTRIKITAEMHCRSDTVFSAIRKNLKESRS